MTVVRVVENGMNSDGFFDAVISVGDWAEYEITVASPADAAAESELEWYFQEHLRFPFLDIDREQAARDRIVAYGQDLFSQVFGGAAHYDYRRLRDMAFDGCRLEVNGSAKFHALHWEALRDPDIPDPLVTRLPVTRRVGRLGSKWDQAAGQPTLNILVVTARPDGLQSIEHELLAGTDSNELLLQGLAGAGKSTLLAHLAWWWKRTGLVSEVFSYTYEQRAWTADEMIRDIRSRLLVPEQQARADAMPADAQLEQAARLLRASRHLLILDNAESVTATAASIPHALPAAEQNRLKTFLSRLRGGRTLVLIGSREPETWLTASGPVAGTYRLPGLDPQAASTLVQRILARYGADSYLRDPQERVALGDLMDLLGGYPLPLTVVLPVLADAPPSAVLGDLRAGGTGADPAGLIAAAIEYSHGKLDPVIQNSLLLLAPFTGVIALGQPLKVYEDTIRVTEAARSLGMIDLDAAVKQAVSVGLASPYSQHTGFVQLQPVLPYFLRGKLRGQEELRTAADAAHFALYLTLSGVILGMLDAQDDPKRRRDARTIARAEYANLKTALDYGLRNGHRIGPIVEALEEYLDQDEQPTARRALVQDAIATHVTPHTKDQQQSLASLNGLAGGIALHEGRLADAKRHYEASLELYEQLGDQKNQLMAVRQLGQIADAEGNRSAAEDPVELALRMALESGDKLGAANCHFSLGNSAKHQGQFDSAILHYQEAIGIYSDLGLRHAMANCLFNMASAISKPGRLAEAEAAFLQAREIFSEFGDDRGVAQSLHALGNLAEERRDLDKAETLYRQALESYFRFADPILVASMFSDIADLAKKRWRLEEAAANYQKALELLLDAGQQEPAALVCKQLADVCERQGLPDEQEARIQQAAGLLSEIGDQPSAAGFCVGLSLLALARGHRAQAAEANRKAVRLLRESGNEDAASDAGRNFDAIADHLETAANYREALARCQQTDDQACVGRQHHALAHLAETLQQFGVALAAYREGLAAFRAAGDTRMVADAYHHVGSIIARYRGFRAAAESFAQAASLYLEIGDREQAAHDYQNFASCAREDSRLADAESGYRRALEIHLEIGAEEDAARSNYELAQTALRQDHLDDAAAEFRRALDYYLTADSGRAADILTRLGWIATRQDRHAIAEAHYRRALELMAGKGNSPDLLIIAYGLAEAAQGQSRAEEATKLYRRALQMAQKEGNDTLTDLINHRLNELATLSMHSISNLATLAYQAQSPRAVRELRLHLYSAGQCHES